MPEFIEIDITNLNVGDSIHMQDIVLASGLSHTSDKNFTVVTCHAPQKAEAETTETEAVVTEEKTSEE